MYKPLISVIMPAYNAEKYIAKSIESVLEQTYVNFELIIVNDASTDNTDAIIDKYCKKDSRITKYLNSKNSGVAYTRNFGIEKANGEWITFLDSDDLWREDKLQKQIDLLIKNKMEPILVYTGSSFIDENDNQYKYVMEVPKQIEYKQLLKQNIISCSSVLVKKEAFNNIKMEHDNMHEDFLLWLNILKKYKINAFGVNEPLLTYRISKNSKSGNKIKAAKMTYMVYKHIGLNLIQRMYYMFHYITRSLMKYKNIKNI